MRNDMMIMNDEERGFWMQSSLSMSILQWLITIHYNNQTKLNKTKIRNSAYGHVTTSLNRLQVYNILYNVQEYSALHHTA